MDPQKCLEEIFEELRNVIRYSQGHGLHVDSARESLDQKLEDLLNWLWNHGFQPRVTASMMGALGDCGIVGVTYKSADGRFQFYFDAFHQKWILEKRSKDQIGGWVLHCDFN